MQIYSAQEKVALLKELDDSLVRVREALARVENRSLNTADRDVVNRIKTLRQQAETAREQDLVAAVSLARIADLLAKDLLGRL